MNRRRFLSGLAVSLVCPLAARADDLSASIISELQSQGFGGFEVETTWLGRLRIVATRADGRREIVLNPQTGEILRDAWTGRTGAAALLNDLPGGRSGKGKTDETSAEDDGVDDQDDDNSGSGSGSSGSGSSGSGDRDDSDDAEDKDDDSGSKDSDSDKGDEPDEDKDN